MGPSTKNNLATLFGGTDIGNEIGKLVENFDFSKIDVKDSSRQDFLTAKLAPSYGNLSETMQQMDDSLKVMIALTVDALAKIKPEDRSWEKIMSTMMSCGAIEPATEEIARTDHMNNSGVNVFKFDGSPNEQIVKNVESWFDKLLDDAEVRKATQIDIGAIANIFAQSGATVDSVEAVIYKSEEHEKTLVDIGVLRFPDIDNPHFQIYRIKLTAWSKSKRIAMVQEDTNGIAGEYNSRKFKPRESIMKSLTSTAVANIVNDLNSVWG